MAHNYLKSLKQTADLQVAIDCICLRLFLMRIAVDLRPYNCRTSRSLLFENTSRDREPEKFETLGVSYDRSWFVMIGEVGVALNGNTIYLAFWTARSGGVLPLFPPIIFINF